MSRKQAKAIAAHYPRKADTPKWMGMEMQKTVSILLFLRLCKLSSIFGHLFSASYCFLCFVSSAKRHRLGIFGISSFESSANNEIDSPTWETERQLNWFYFWAWRCLLLGLRFKSVERMLFEQFDDEWSERRVLITWKIGLIVRQHRVT